MFEQLDRINKKIIRMLLEDSRRPYREIAEKLGLSESTVRKRVMKMINDKIIERFTIALNPERTGKAVTAFITLTPTKGHFKTIADLCKLLPEAVEVYGLAGNCGIILKVQVANLVELDAFVESLRIKTEIEDIETCVVLRPIKKEVPYLF
ncbi:MAG: Lrp/AsnC family transcriptional regulator [Promethearchaeota archaeon]